MPDDPNVTLASMGIYVFKWKFLRELLTRRQGRPELHPRLRQRPDPRDREEREGHRPPLRRLLRAPHRPTRRPTGATWERSTPTGRPTSTSADFTPELDLWDSQWPIWTYSESVPPAKFVHDSPDRRGSAVSSLVSGGCIISGTEVRNSLLFTMVHTNSYATLDHAVVLPYADVGRHARLRNVVVDRGVHVPEGLVVGEDPVEDARWFRVSEGGITLITQDMLDRRAAAL